MLKVARAELAVWLSVAKGLKQWVAQTAATAAKAAMYGWWPTVTLRHSWHFVIIRTVVRRTGFTAKVKTFTVVVVKI
jgi:hypothetical protein